MPNFATYPRCYVRRLPQDCSNSFSQGDAELMVLWDLFMNCKVDTSTWQYRKRILAAAMRLFDGFSQWVDDNSRDPNVAGYTLDFLKDTLTYLETGKRRLHPLQWLELMPEVEEISTVHGGQRLNVTPAHGLRSTSEALQLWCSYQGGFEDLVLSLYLFFGGQRMPDAPDDREHRTVGIAD
jgi:hypothetical protein